MKIIIFNRLYLKIQKYNNFDTNEKRVYAVVLINLNEEEDEKETFWIRLKLLIYSARY